jgi:hypothetical protein
MENIFAKHHEIKNQLRQIITNEYQEKHDFSCVPSGDPEKDIIDFKKKVCDKFKESRNDNIKLEKYIYMIPDIRNHRIVIKF